mmetsp:Transcript_17003/g.28387  ORF Transcript_17003/g.28387 Transcript_17003/m.28387 type:complete len:210 (+) Transcript_17003:2244-2873(+)
MLPLLLRAKDLHQPPLLGITGCTRHRQLAFAEIVQVASLQCAVQLMRPTHDGMISYHIHQRDLASCSCIKEHELATEAECRAARSTQPLWRFHWTGQRLLAIQTIPIRRRVVLQRVNRHLAVKRARGDNGGNARRPFNIKRPIARSWKLAHDLARGRVPAQCAVVLARRQQEVCVIGAPRRCQDASLMADQLPNRGKSVAKVPDLQLRR